MQKYLPKKGDETVAAPDTESASFVDTPTHDELKEFWASFHDLIRSAGREPQRPVDGPVSALEAIHGSHRSRPVETWGIPLIGACFAVARIDFKSGQHNGTGFLVEAKSIGLPIKGVVVVTCNHVVCDPDKPGATVKYSDTKHPDRMKITFQLRDPNVSHECEVIWQSPVDELDISILRLTPQPTYRRRHPSEALALVLAKNDPPLEVLGHNRRWRLSRLFALHHPDGRKLEWSLEDNFFRGAKPREGTTFPTFLHYEAPTESGSSGAPILNEALEVVAVHRANSETLHDGEHPVTPKRAVNEGLSIQSLRAALKEAFKDSRSAHNWWRLW